MVARRRWRGGGRAHGGRGASQGHGYHEKRHPRAWRRPKAHGYTARGVPAHSSCLGPAALWRPRERPKRGRMVPQGCQGSHAQPPSSSAPADAAYLQPAHAGSTSAQSCARMTLGLRRVLPIWAARLLCRTVRAPPPDWRGRGSRALSPHALVHTRRSVPIGCHRQVLVR